MRNGRTDDRTDPQTAMWCAVPVYNNAGTLRSVVERTLVHWPHVLVVDDGSTDADLAELLAGLPCVYLRHDVNCGKGAAILTAAQEAARRGARWLVTLDGDGQHAPADLPAFLRVLQDMGDDDTHVVIGTRDMSAPHIPKGSRFGRSFSDAWVRIETGVRVPDTQSGFRAYPVRHLLRLRLRARRYDFEIESLVRLLWGGLEAVSVPISVWYPQPSERRITHFRPFKDNLRLSGLHARLVLRRLLPWPHQRLAPRHGLFQAFTAKLRTLAQRRRGAEDAGKINLCVSAPLRSPRETASLSSLSSALNPLAFFRELWTASSSPFELAASAAVGIFFGTLPLVASHSIAIAYVSARLRLNMILALSVQSLCAPPVVPAACILLGYRLRTGAWMTDLAWAKIPSEYLNRLLEWLLGSLVLAPVLTALAAFGVYALAKLRVLAQKRRGAGDVAKMNLRVSASLRSPREIASFSSQSKQRGNAFGMAWFRMLVRVGGLRAAYAMLYPVALHYALFDCRAVEAIRPYIRHRFPGAPRFRQWLAAYRIFLEQGRMLVDRHAALARPGLVDITIDDSARAELTSLAAGGGVLVMSHVGNWQVAIPALANLGKPVHLVMAAETNAAVAKALRVDGASGAVQVIDVKQFMDAAPKIVAALTASEIVSVMGDRAYGAAAAPVTFLGGTARFPVAAFRIAAATGKPVCLLFVPRTGRGRYVVQTPAAMSVESRGSIHDGLARYAASLEAFSQAHPFQCFPFADLWA